MLKKLSTNIMLKKLSTIDEIQKSLANLSADTKTQWGIQYPVVDTSKLSEIKKALWGFEDWAREKGVEYKSEIKRHFKLRQFKFDYTVHVLFQGTLKDVGSVLSNYVEVLISVNLVPSETELHLHSISADENIEDPNDEGIDCEDAEPWDDCDHDCYDCDNKDECPERE